MTAAARTQAARALGVVLVLTGAMLPGPARAQLLGQYFPVGIPGHDTWFSDAVADRPHTEYDPLGVRTGAFVVRPSLSEGFGYDSNILAAPRATGSAFAETRGAIAAASDWSRDALNGEIGFDDVRYPQQALASHTDWTAALGGERDIGRDQANAAYTHATATATPAQIGTPGIGPPVTQALDTARVGYEATFGRWTLAPAFQAASYRFIGGPAGRDGTRANDRDVFAGSATAGYDLAPGSSLVMVANAAHAAFTAIGAGLPAPDYDDASLVAGIDYRSGSLFRTRATLGYERRDYRDPRLSGTSAPLAELDAIWTPTRLTTVTGQVSRNLQDAITTGGADSFAYTDVRLTVDHEYRRNVLLQGFGEFQTADYRTRGQTQRIVSAGASVTWLLGRTVSVIGRVGYARSTDTGDSALDQSGGFAGLTLAFHP